MNSKWAISIWPFSILMEFLEEKIMEGSVYSNLGLKVNRTFRGKRDDDVFSIKDLLEHKWILHNNEDLKKVFIRELKILLQKEDLFELIHAFFELENDLNMLLDQVEFEVKVFNFDDFYKNLSPVLMRSLLVNAKNPDNAPLILKSIKESLRVTIEEELYQSIDRY